VVLEEMVSLQQLQDLLSQELAVEVAVAKYMAVLLLEDPEDLVAVALEEIQVEQMVQQTLVVVAAVQIIPKDLVDRV
jgi:hypothetical protein